MPETRILSVEDDADVATSRASFSKAKGTLSIPPIR
jgi:hypothetical protein